MDAIQTALDMVASGASSRSIDMRLAKARCQHLGIRWPPKQPPTFTSYLHLHAFKAAAYLPMHNFGLCMLPNVMELVLQLIWEVPDHFGRT